MKRLIFDDIYSWSIFSEMRQVDFNGHLWVRPEGNVLIDPVPMIDSDLNQFDGLGGASLIVLTNSDHEREAEFFRKRTGANITIHEADADALEVAADRQITVADGEEIVPAGIADSKQFICVTGRVRERSRSTFPKSGRYCQGISSSGNRLAP